MLELLKLDPFDAGDDAAPRSSAAAVEHAHAVHDRARSHAVPDARSRAGAVRPVPVAVARVVVVVDKVLARAHASAERVVRLAQARIDHVHVRAVPAMSDAKVDGTVEREGALIGAVEAPRRRPSRLERVHSHVALDVLDLGRAERRAQQLNILRGAGLERHEPLSHLKALALESWEVGLCLRSEARLRGAGSGGRRRRSIVVGVAGSLGAESTRHLPGTVVQLDDEAEGVAAGAMRGVRLGHGRVVVRSRGPRALPRRSQGVVQRRQRVIRGGEAGGEQHEENHRKPHWVVGGGVACARGRARDQM
mmetsp:Transcript_1831/g.6726  ORF Transcript_1831/g.6726 Transcript_1831/m.6726 type:complete len:307 (+) Transcript_1831:3536-4456(+)